MHSTSFIASPLVQLLGTALRNAAILDLWACVIASGLLALKSKFMSLEALQSGTAGEGIGFGAFFGDPSQS